MENDKNTQSPRYPCYISEFVYQYTFHVNFLLKRISLVATESHASHTTWNGVIANHGGD